MGKGGPDIGKITLMIAITVMMTEGVALTGLSHGVPFVWAMPSGEQAESARRTYGLYFPEVAVPHDAGIGLVRIVVTCGRVAAVTRIPDDWYVRTLRPAFQSGPEWSEFQFASNAVEFEAGHGVTRLLRLTSLDGAIRITVEDKTCFDITSDIKDEFGSAWKVRLHKAQLRLRN